MEDTIVVDHVPVRNMEEMPEEILTILTREVGIKKITEEVEMIDNRDIGVIIQIVAIIREGIRTGRRFSLTRVPKGSTGPVVMNGQGADMTGMIGTSGGSLTSVGIEGEEIGMMMVIKEDIREQKDIITTDLVDLEAVVVVKEVMVEAIVDNEALKIEMLPRIEIKEAAGTETAINVVKRVTFHVIVQINKVLILAVDLPEEILMDL